VTSIPPGLITSQFYGYNGSYTPADSIRPGRGYWVKVNQAGKLVFATGVTMTSKTDLIRIVPSTELPPPPPESEISNPRSAIPREFVLEQNYPNPFNPLTVIRYSLMVNSYVTLKVYDVLGREVATLVDERLDAGYKEIHFDAGGLPSGVYLYKLVAGSFQNVKKMLFVK
jgi:hypothetical protein